MMNGAVAERTTTAGRKKALRFAPGIARSVARVGGCRWLAFRGASDSTQTGETRCEHCRRYMLVAKARARRGHSSGPSQLSKGRLGVQDVPIDRGWQGRGQWSCEQRTQGTAGSCDGEVEASGG